MAWPGQKLPIYDAVGLAGSTTTSERYYNLDLASDPDGVDTSTFDTGDEFYIYSDSPRTLLETDEIGECNWIVDVVSTGATVEVYLGYDEDWNYSGVAIAASWVPAAVTLVVGRNVIPLQTALRTYDGLTQDGAPLIRFKVVSGTIVMQSVYLQVEPPDGLKEMTGWHWGEWITPPLIKMTPKADVESWSYRGIPTISRYSGPYNEVPSSNEYYPSPTWKEKLDEGYGALEEWQHNVITDAVTTGGAAAAQASFGGEVEMGNETAPWHPSGQGFDYWTLVSTSWSHFKAKWTTYPAHRQTPSAIPGVQNRDWVSVSGSFYEWSPTGVTETVGWVPGAIVPLGRYTQEEFPVPDPPPPTSIPGAPELVLRPSPHGETYNLSGIQSVSASIGGNGQLNDTFIESVNRPADGVTYYPVAPPPNSDVQLNASMALPGFSETEPNPFGSLRTWSQETGATIWLSGFVTFYWVEVVPYDITGGWYLQGTWPRLELQMPDYRLKVPDFTPSADAVVPSEVPVEEHPTPGTFLFPAPNLDGEDGFVRVSFATS